MAGTKKKKGILLGPAIGYSLGILFGLFGKNKIPFRFYPRVLAITLINLINWPFRTYERLFINPRFNKIQIEKEPVFIIGHWRSGTTHLHNLLCKDTRMGYVSTYQSVFPDTVFGKAGRILFENIMKMLIPGTRKGDNVTLGTKLPQEEEFALGDKTPLCYYYFWLFPQNISHYYHSFVRFENIDPKLVESWKRDYQLLVKKALRDSGGERILLKNPTNTGRIKVLLEIFPKAKFIHIHRNPLEVFLSTKHFYEVMMKPLQLQDISNHDIKEAVIEIYKKIMQDYLDQKDLIPEGNLVEVSFDELENNATEVLDRIYTSFNLEKSIRLDDTFQAYLENMKTYSKNKHRISRDDYNRVMQEWQFMMNKYEYNTPESIEIKDA